MQKALREAESAASKAQRALKEVHKLPSARVRGQLPQPVRAVLSTAAYVLLAVAFVASHGYGRHLQLAFAVVAGSGVAAVSFTKGYVSPSGAAAAALVGSATQASNVRASATLVAFFLSSSKLTKFKEELKSGSEDFKAGGQRDWKQVVGTGLVPTILAVLAGSQVGFVDLPLSSLTHKTYTALMGGFLGYFACCCGDTWASEAGQLSEETPRLITTLRPVRKGTNGGVTKLGLFASLTGGLFIGLVFWAAVLVSPSLRLHTGAFDSALRQWPVIWLGAAAGFVGSLIDSLLGATMQFTGFNIGTQKITSKRGEGITQIAGVSFLDNNMVNVLSSAITALLCAIIVQQVV